MQINLVLEIAEFVRFPDFAERCPASVHSPRGALFSMNYRIIHRGFTQGYSNHFNERFF